MGSAMVNLSHHLLKECCCFGSVVRSGWWWWVGSQGSLYILGVITGHTDRERGDMEWYWKD